MARSPLGSSRQAHQRNWLSCAAGIGRHLLDASLSELPNPRVRVLCPTTGALGNALRQIVERFRHRH